MSRKYVYREGDRVRIVRSRFIERIGYPLTWIDLVPEFAQHPKLDEACALLGVVRTADFIRGCAMAAVKARGFGGKTRAIHYYETVAAGEIYDRATRWPDYTGHDAYVSDKYVRQTGTYYGGAGGVTYEGEHWYENGGLDDRKTHLILRTNLGDIEACDVEPVES